MNRFAELICVHKSTFLRTTKQRSHHLPTQSHNDAHNVVVKTADKHASLYICILTQVSLCAELYVHFITK